MILKGDPGSGVAEPNRSGHRNRRWFNLFFVVYLHKIDVLLPEKINQGVGCGGIIDRDGSKNVQETRHRMLGVDVEEGGGM